MKNVRYNYWGKLIGLLLLFMGGGFYLNFAVDTYWTFMLGFDFAAKDTLVRNGRPIIALVYKAADILGASGESFYYFSFILAFICFIISIHIYEKLLRPFIKSENLRLILSFLCIMNLFTIEFFMFLERGLFSLAILFNVIAVKYIDKAIENAQKIYFAVAMLAVFCATLIYQGTIALFFMLSIPLVYKRTKTFCKYVVGLVDLVLVYWIPVSLDLLLFRIWFSPDRIIYEDSVSNEIGHIIQAYKNVYKDAFSLLPKYMFFTVTIIVMTIAVMSMLLKKSPYMNMVNFLVLTLAVNILPIASVLMSPIIRPRIVYPIASSVAIFIVNYYVNDEVDNEIKGKYISASLYLICAVLLVSQYFSYNKIYTDRYKANYADYVRVQEIGEAILEYELQTGNKIKQIAFYRDSNHDIPFYQGLYYDGDLVLSGFHSWDSELRMVNYYLGTNYDRCPEEDGYASYFAQFDWHCYSPMQIRCDNDTLHYCVY